MKAVDFVIFDFETGGLKADLNPAVEIALITIDGKTLKEKNRWETFIKPYDNLTIERAALNANGLKMSDINSGLSKQDLINELKDYFLLSNPTNAVMKRPIMVGHNVKFDMSFIEYIFKDDKKGLFNYVSKIQIDTLTESLRAFPNETSHKLSDICALVGISLVDAHKAMNDTIATKDLFIHFTKKLRTKKGETSSLGNSIELQSSKRIIFQF
jgi:DNA polymerase III alpha subunit (gram-positive type)